MSGETFGGWSGTPRDAAADRHSAGVWTRCVHTPLVLTVYAIGWVRRGFTLDLL